MKILAFAPCYFLCILLFTGCATANSKHSTTDDGLAQNPAQMKAPATTEALAPAAPKIKVPKSYVERKGNEVIVYIFIDNNKEKLKYLKGTAMLRTKAYLKREFKQLPKNYSIPCRCLKNTFDEETGIYYYFTSFKLEDIEKRLQVNEITQDNP